MAASITRLATYVPAGRLDTGEVRRHWPGAGAPAGVRNVAVADVDEDVVTFGVQVLDDLARSVATNVGDGIADIGALIVATCSSPYAEHSVAAEIARALDLPPATTVVDLAGSVRGAVDALVLAAAGVESGRWGRVAIVAADLRRGTIGTAVEAMGCGASAALVEDDAGISIGQLASERRGVPTRWRPNGAAAVRVYDDPRYERDELLVPTVRAAVAAAAPEASFIAGSYTDARVAAAFAAACGIDGRRGDDVAETGDLGTPGPLVALAQCLEGAEAGTKGVIVAAEAGAGADAIAVTVDEPIAVHRRAPKGQPISYVAFLQRTGALPSDGLTPIVPWSATPGAYRDDLVGSLVGSECADCGSVSIPPRPLCVDCGGDRSVRRGIPRRCRLVTHNRQHVVALAPEPAPVAVGVARLDGLDGNRGGQVSAMFCESLDGLAVGAPVELVYRRLGADEGLVKYGWKLRLAGDTDA
jgi:uncharacterized OB-fold protein